MTCTRPKLCVTLSHCLEHIRVARLDVPACRIYALTTLTALADTDHEPTHRLPRKPDYDVPDAVAQLFYFNVCIAIVLVRSPRPMLKGAFYTCEEAANGQN